MILIAILLIGCFGTSHLFAENGAPSVRIAVPTYSRERMLESAALQIETIQRDRNIPLLEKRDRVAEIITQTDATHFSYLRFTVRDPVAVMTFARELETKWTGNTPSGYVQALSSLAVGLLRGPPAYQDLEMSERLVRGSFDLLPEVPTKVALGALLRFNMDWEVSSERRLVPMDWIPRDAALDSYVRVLGDVNAFLKNVNSNAYAGLTDSEVRSLGFDVWPETFAGRTNTLEARREFAQRREMLKAREYYDSKVGKNLDNDPWGGHEEKLQRAFTNHLQRHYSMAPADLDEVQLALDKFVKDPALKERLVLAAYKGTNPFTGRTPIAKQAAEGKAKAGASTDKATVQQSKAAQSVKKTTAQSVTDQPPAAADSGPLATASGVSMGNSLLWLAFVGAGALIAAVLWRAQARAHPRQTK